jgi:signal peptide peptidase SppA
MIQPHFISAILNEPWAISEEAAIGLSSILSRIFDPTIEFEKGSPLPPSLHAASSPAAGPSSRGSAVGDPGVKQISVITIGGPLMKNDQYCGPAGMKTMGGWIQQADKDPAIDGILLVIDSPGGTVSGTEELGAIIKGTKKPIIAFVEDMACSAAYWLASCADEIIANNTTAQVGSIGVLLSFMDIQPALEKQGVVFHTITAPQSTEKTAMFDKVRAGDYEEYQNTVLKPLAAKFIDTVTSNRASAENSQLSGAVFFAKDVIGSLVDSIATFEQALQRVAELASTPSATFNPQINTMNKPELKRLAIAAGVPEFESSDGSISLTMEVAQAVESALEAHETAQAALQAQIDTSTNQQARVTELEGELQTANDRIAELSNEAGANSASIIKDTDAEEGSSIAGGFWNRFHNLKNK